MILRRTHRSAGLPHPSVVLTGNFPAAMNANLIRIDLHEKNTFKAGVIVIRWANQQPSGALPGHSLAT